jgi:hypothetical protein
MEGMFIAMLQWLAYAIMFTWSFGQLQLQHTQPFQQWQCKVPNTLILTKR